MYYAPTRALRGNHLPGQLPTAEHFNRLLSSVQRAMAGAHFKVAPLADAEEEKVPQLPVDAGKVTVTLKLEDFCLVPHPLVKIMYGMTWICLYIYLYIYYYDLGESIHLRLHPKMDGSR